MGNIPYAEPHYHANNEYEIYFVLQGNALVIVGGKEHQLEVGDYIVIPPYTAHFTIPDKEFVIAVVNTPPFDPHNYHILTATNTSVQYDATQFAELVKSKSLARLRYATICLVDQAYTLALRHIFWCKQISQCTSMVAI